MKKKIDKNQNETDVSLSSGECMPRSAYMNKYGKGMSDAELGAFVRKNYEEYLRKIEENTPYWQEEGESFRRSPPSFEYKSKRTGRGNRCKSDNGGKV